MVQPANSRCLFVCLWLVGAAAVGCGDHPSSPRVQHLERITIQTSSCGMRGCSTTFAVVHANGRVAYSYNGRGGLEATQTKQLDASQLLQLIRDVDRAEYFGLRERYGSYVQCQGTDRGGSVVITTVQADGRSLTIRHDKSCESAYSGAGEPAPSQLSKLERSITRVLGLEQWVAEIHEREQLRRAKAENEQPPSFELGQALERAGNGQGAVKAYIRAARGGNCQAAKRVGDLYKTGFADVARDQAEAKKWHQVATVLGCDHK